MICRKLICACTSKEKQNVTTESLSLAFAALLRVCERRWTTCQRKVHFVFTVHGFSFLFFRLQLFLTAAELSQNNHCADDGQPQRRCLFSFQCFVEFGSVTFHLTSCVLSICYCKRQVNCSEMLLSSRTSSYSASGIKTFYDLSFDKRPKFAVKPDSWRWCKHGEATGLLIWALKVYLYCCSRLWCRIKSQSCSG